MKETEGYDARGRWVTRRAWRNTRGQLHRTTGPAVETWTVLPGGGHVLTDRGWWQNGNPHREGRPAYRRWHVANDGTRVLDVEVWCRHGQDHRVGGPSYREWMTGPDGTRTLQCESWWGNNKLHRVDGPACKGYGFFYWHDAVVGQKDLPWLRRGQGSLVPLAASTMAAARNQVGDGGTAPAWSRDTRAGDLHRHDAIMWGVVSLGGAMNFEVTDTCMLYPHFAPVFWVGLQKVDRGVVKRGSRIGTPPPLQKSFGSVGVPCTRVIVTVADSGATYRSAVGGAVLLCV